MADYRAYTLGHEGHFIGHRAFVCENDADAIEWAKQLVDGHDFGMRGASSSALFATQKKAARG
jgi:hypothetical protein